MVSPSDLVTAAGNALESLFDNHGIDPSGYIEFNYPTLYYCPSHSGSRGESVTGPYNGSSDLAWLALVIPNVLGFFRCFV